MFACIPNNVIDLIKFTKLLFIINDNTTLIL